MLGFLSLPEYIFIQQLLSLKSILENYYPAALPYAFWKSTYSTSTVLSSSISNHNQCIQICLHSPNPHWMSFMKNIIFSQTMFNLVPRLFKNILHPDARLIYLSLISILQGFKITPAIMENKYGHLVQLGKCFVRTTCFYIFKLTGALFLDGLINLFVTEVIWVLETNPSSVKWINLIYVASMTIILMFSFSKGT